MTRDEERRIAAIRMTLREVEEMNREIQERKIRAQSHRIKRTLDRAEAVRKARKRW